MKTIKITERDLENIVKKVLMEQKVEPPLKFGDKSDEVGKLQQKLMDIGYLKTKSMTPTKYFGNLTQGALKKFQKDVKLPQTGTYDQQTKNYLLMSAPDLIGMSSKKPTSSSTSTKDKSKPKSNNEGCIAISDEECKKISSNNQVSISSGSEKRCSAYMVKCLSQYDSELYGANAWDVFNTVKNQGTVKYNAFTSGEINWTNIWSQLVKNKVTKSICEKHAATDDADKSIGSAVPAIVTNSIPQSPKINISSLKLGDIVGLYHKNSGNKGMAFCQRVLKRGLDNNGNVKDKDPFTFNSHVGFVGAIKNGVPIIIHNVHGTHLATPATKMLTKNSEDMIVWVVSDNDITSAIEKRKPKSSLPQYYATK